MQRQLSRVTFCIMLLYSTTCLAGGNYQILKNSNGVFFQTDKDGIWSLNETGRKKFKSGQTGTYSSGNDKNGFFLITDTKQKIYVDIKGMEQEIKNRQYHLVESFLSGNRIKYSTKNNPKAKGIDLCIEFPSDWIVEETDSADSIYNFKKINLDGSYVYAYLIIRESLFYYDKNGTKINLFFQNNDQLYDCLVLRNKELNQNCRIEKTNFGGLWGFTVIDVYKEKTNNELSDVYLQIQYVLNSGKLVQCTYMVFGARNDIYLNPTTIYIDLLITFC